MKILVINSGSSSLKFKLYSNEKLLVSGLAEEIGKRNSSFNKKKMKIKNHLSALKLALDFIINKKFIKSLEDIDVVGHRVVHGGDKYKKPVLINEKVIKTIKEFKELAPLHNPANLKGILACKRLLKVKQVAVFDTAFHSTIPKKAFLYGIPLKYYKKYGIRKYGFHGINHEYLYLETKKLLKNKSKKIITCHLGNGSSVTAIKNGKSVDTSMGFTPLQGLMMGTRSGDIDPEVVEFISKKEHKFVGKIIDMLNLKSGFKGLTGESDFRKVSKLAKKGNKKAKLAIDMYVYKLEEYIGAYKEVLGGLDALVFSGGIGQNNSVLRSKLCKALDIKLDSKKNNKNSKIISKGKVKVLVIPANEELMIAKACRKF